MLSVWWYVISWIMMYLLFVTTLVTSVYHSHVWMICDKQFVMNHEEWIMFYMNCLLLTLQKDESWIKISYFFLCLFSSISCCPVHIETSVQYYHSSSIAHDFYYSSRGAAGCYRNWKLDLTETPMLRSQDVWPQEPHWKNFCWLTGADCVFV